MANCIAPWMSCRILSCVFAAALVVSPSLHAASGAGDLSSAPTNAHQQMAGAWHAHTYDFHYMGFTSLYTCTGLANMLHVLLKQLGAEHLRITPICPLGQFVPDRFAHARVKFSSLIPSPAASASGTATTMGLWRHIRWAPNHPQALREGDCELIQEFRDKLLPMFAARHVDANVSCIPHQNTGAFSLSFDVFVPIPTAKSPIGGSADKHQT